MGQQYYSLRRAAFLQEAGLLMRSVHQYSKQTVKRNGIANRVSPNTVCLRNWTFLFFLLGTSYSSLIYNHNRWRKRTKKHCTSSELLLLFFLFLNILTLGMLLEMTKFCQIVYVRVKLYSVFIFQIFAVFHCFFTPPFMYIQHFSLC